MWKVVEETQLVFRGGRDPGKTRRGKEKANDTDREQELDPGVEGSIERVAFVDEETFVSGSDNGTISLWSMHKKKPIFTVPAAHGYDDPPSKESYLRSRMWMVERCLANLCHDGLRR